MKANNNGTRNRSDAINSRPVNQNNQKKLEADKTNALFIRSDSKSKPTPNGRLSQSLSKIGSKCRDAMSHIATKFSKQKPVEHKLATSHVKSPKLNAPDNRPLPPLPSAEVMRKNVKNKLIHDSAHLLEPVFPEVVKKFTEVRANRKSDPETYRLYQNFARDAAAGDSVDFLAVMDDLKADPNIEKIRLILYVFIVEEKEDMIEFNPLKPLTADSQNKKTINLPSSEARNELISALNAKLSSALVAESSEEAKEDLLQEMVGLLATAEKSAGIVIDGSVPNALRQQLKALRLINAATASAPLDPQMLA